MVPRAFGFMTPECYSGVARRLTVLCAEVARVHEGRGPTFPSHVRGACAPRIHIDGYGYTTYIGYAGSACVSVGDPLHFTARGFSALEECSVTQVSLVLLGGRDRELCVWILRGSLFSVESRRQARTV